MALGEEESGQHISTSAEASDPSSVPSGGGENGTTSSALEAHAEVMTEFENPRDPDDSGLGKSDEQQTKSTGPATRAPDIKYPTKTTDLLTGFPTLALEEEGSSLVEISAATSLARRQTSHSGCPALDQLSLATVHSQTGVLSLIPGERDILHNTSDEPIYQSDHLDSGHLEVQLINLEANERLNTWSLGDSFEPFPSNGEDASESANIETNDRVAETNSSHALSEMTGQQLSQSEVHKKQLMSGTRLDPFYPQLATTASRMATFDGVTVLDGLRVDKLKFAENGFFFKVKQEYKSVICFHCGCSPREWEDGMDPRTEHIILSPRCRAVFP